MPSALTVSATAALACHLAVTCAYAFLFFRERARVLRSFLLAWSALTLRFTFVLAEETFADAVWTQVAACLSSIAAGFFLASAISIWLGSAAPKSRVLLAASGALWVVVGAASGLGPGLWLLPVDLVVAAVFVACGLALVRSSRAGGAPLMGWALILWGGQQATLELFAGRDAILVWDHILRTAFFVLGTTATIAAYLRRLRQDLERRVSTLTEEIESARHDAGKVVEAKDAFLAKMGHELRAPMSGIIGMTELALSRELEPQVREYLERVLESGETLLVLLNDLLDFSRIAADRLPIRPREFVVRDVISRSAETFRPKAEQAGLDLRVSIATGVPARVVGDDLRLGQILINLVGNAVKFTRQGQVELEVRTTGEDDTSVDLLFAVRDTGIGIPSGKEEQIFREFTQADNSTTREFDGSGLGLAIAKRLAELMGGSLTFTSEVGRGSEFEVRLSFQAASDSTVTGRVDSGSDDSSLAGGRRLRVLVVDDAEVSRVLAEALLRQAGHEVTTLARGDAVPDLLERESFDLVLLDVHMPGMDGIEVVRWIRDREAGSERYTRVVAVTSLAFEEDGEACLEAGMDGHLPKPLRRRSLAKLLDQVFGDGRFEATPSIDLQAALIRLRGDEELLREIAKVFLDEAPGVLEDLLGAATSRSPEDLAAKAHRLAGMASHFDARGLAECASTIERHASEGAVDDALLQLDDLRRWLDQLTSDLETLTARNERGE